MSTQTIPISQGGQEYTWPLTITELNGKDISGDTVQLSLATLTAPGTWRSPDTDPVQTDHSKRVVQILLGGAFLPPVGLYGLWWKIGDAPETVIRFGFEVRVI